MIQAGIQQGQVAQRKVRIGVLCQPSDARAVGQGGNLYDYVDAVAANGAEPVTLEIPQEYYRLVQQNGRGDAFSVPLPDDMAKQLLGSVDGILVPGGSDVDPRFYDPNAKNGMNSKTLFDAYELGMIRQAIAMGMPTLGICRGLQLMNVAVGGRLIKDIPTEVQRPADMQIEHQQRHIASLRGDINRAVHSVIINEEGLGRPSVLRSLINTTSISVNSAHHQAAMGLNQDQLPLAVTARATDGIIEGLESRTNPTIWAVQWHPERQCLDSRTRQDDSYDRFFQRLIVDAANFRHVVIPTQAAGVLQPVGEPVLAPPASSGAPSRPAEPVSQQPAPEPAAEPTVISGGKKSRKRHEPPPPPPSSPLWDSLQEQMFPLIS